MSKVVNLVFMPNSGYHAIDGSLYITTSDIYECSTICTLYADIKDKDGEEKTIKIYIHLSKIHPANWNAENPTFHIYVQKNCFGEVRCKIYSVGPENWFLGFIRTQGTELVASFRCNF